MRKVIVTEWMSLDGVVQAPGAADEDTTGGFAHGGSRDPWGCLPHPSRRSPGRYSYSLAVRAATFQRSTTSARRLSSPASLRSR